MTATPPWGDATPLPGCEVIRPEGGPSPARTRPTAPRPGRGDARRATVRQRFRDLSAFLRTLHPGLAPTERTVWLAVFAFSEGGRATVTQRTLARVGGVTDRAVRTSYAWGDEKAFIVCKFRVTEKDQVVASGTEILARDPSTGRIRGWLFDRSGTLAEAYWTRDRGQWVVEIAGTLPGGDELEATNAVVPAGPNAFSWVSVDRSAGGQPLPNGAPLKVTRVRK